MSKIVIRKKVSLEFLGEEYKEAYLVFRALPLRDYEKIQDELPDVNSRYVELINKADSNELTAEENDELLELQKTERGSDKRSFNIVSKYLKEYFINGKFPNEDGILEDVTDSEDLDGLDKDSAVKCFKVLTGQDSDPKVED